MATYDLEEQEQLDNLKAWWKQYGNLITGIVVVVSVVVVAWRGWGWYQQSQSAQASTIYAALQQAVEARDMQRVKGATGELLEKFGGTTYATMGALLAGKAAADTGDLKMARAQLAWAAEKASDEMKDLARLRLAAVLMEEKAFDEAIRQVETSSTPSFAARFADVRGDALLSQGKRGEAKAAYKAAIDANSRKTADGAADTKAPTAFLEMVQQKLDTLGDA